MFRVPIQVRFICLFFSDFFNIYLRSNIQQEIMRVKSTFILGVNGGTSTRLQREHGLLSPVWCLGHVNI
uniref:Uncharacterized protein n=1 Tax=Arundo donax TaxID=35708 RepID=A0A0A9BG40_ARUDO